MNPSEVIINKQFDRHRIIINGKKSPKYKDYDIAMMIELCKDCMMAATQQVTAALSEAKDALIWRMIEDWQDAREQNDDEYLNEPRFSFTDIEYEFYQYFSGADKDKPRQQLSERPGMKKWSYCPECGNTEVENKNLLGEGFRNCSACGQEWWTNVDYSETIPKILRYRKAEIAQLKAQPPQPKEGEKEQFAIGFQWYILNHAVMWADEVDKWVSESGEYTMEELLTLYKSSLETNKKI